MRLHLLRSIMAAVSALTILSGCIEPVELTKLRRIQEPRVLAGAASAEQFWSRADAIAHAYKAPASERARLAEMVAIGRRADRGQISLETYRVHHARALARYEDQRKEARRIATRMWSRVFSAAAVPLPSRLARAGEQRVSRGQAVMTCR
jgi:outer membrane murein-binding lipoprotein Lpp